jgi:PilZ domain-containing protein
MSEQRNWKRIRERLALHLPVRVRVRETLDFEWTEITRLTNVTPFGAGFPLKRPTEKGRLLHMTIPMPRQLRVFDHVEDQYRVWALVRYMRTSADDRSMFDIGVAFIGKRPPASYENEPWKRYDILTTAFQALTPPDELLGPLTDQRAYTRHNIAVDMRLELVDASGRVIQTEQTVTENISTKGATIFTTLQISPGRFIRLTSDQHGITAYAAIRSCSTGADGIPRIHVEFVDREWPL